MSISTCLLKSVPFALLFLSSSLNACESWQSDLEPILAKVQQGRGFAALHQIQDLSARCPDVARLKLEMGSIFEHLGDNQQAINIWNQVLENYSVPDKVAIKIRLRILQAQKRVQSPLATHLVARVGKEWLQPQKQSENNLMVSTGVKYVVAPQDFAGFELKTTPYFKATGYTSRNQDINTRSNLISGELGLDIGIKQLNIKTAYSWQKVDQDTSQVIVLTPQVQFGVFKFSHGVDWDIATKDMTFNPKLSIRIFESRLNLESVYQRVNQITTLENTAISLRWGKRARPELSSKYHWVDNELDIESALSIIVNRHWMVSGFAEYTFATSSSAKTGVNLTWRR